METIHNKPPQLWSTIPGSNGISKNLNIHPAAQNEQRIAKHENLMKLVKHATRNIPGSGRIIDQHFSQKGYSSFQHVSLNRSKFDQLHAHPF